MRQSTKQRDPEIQDTIEAVIRVILKLAVVLLVVWGLFTFVFGIRQVSGEAMYPRLRDGDLILYYRLEQDYQIGDVVTFQQSGKTYNARIVAMGGDEVDLNADGFLVVNGNVEQEDEIFYTTEPTDNNDIEYPYTVPEGSYFVLCDFRTASIDSRILGAIPQSSFDGKVITLLRRRGI
jgi:signal peptidase I